MKSWFKAEDEMEAKRIVKSFDMALVLFHIQHNMKKGFMYKYEENSDIVEDIFEQISDSIFEHDIIINDLIE